MHKPFNVNKILIPIDFSESSNIALEHAVILCSKYNASLHLLHVLTVSYVDILPNLTATSSHINNTKELRKKVVEELDTIGKDFKEKHGVTYDIEVRNGSITKEIGRSARENKVDMIVMGTHGASGFEEFFLGSNAFRVVTAAAVPTLTIQSHVKKLGYDNIVLPIDSSKYTRDKVSIARAIAEAFGATIHIVGLITDEHQDEKGKFDVKIRQVEEYLDDRNVKHIKKIINGTDIAEMTNVYASVVNADLVVVMTEQEAATGLFVGPYAQRVVNHSKVPILSVTPIEIVEDIAKNELDGNNHPFYL